MSKISKFIPFLAIALFIAVMTVITVALMPDAPVIAVADKETAIEDAEDATDAADATDATDVSDSTTDSSAVPTDQTIDSISGTGSSPVVDSPIDPSPAPAPAPSPESAPAPAPEPVYNSTIIVTRLFENHYNNTKYSIKISDPEGVGSFVVKKRTGSSVFGGGSASGCNGSYVSGTVTISIADFPLTASVTDCGETPAISELSAIMPPLPPKPDLIIDRINNPEIIRGGYRVGVTISNRGVANTGSFYVKFTTETFLDDVDPILMEKFVDDLDAGETVTVHFILDNLDGISGFRAHVDSRLEIVEISDKNNFARLTD